MFKTVHDAVAFAREFGAMVKGQTDVEIVIAPPFTAIHAVADALRHSNVGVAAQDMYWEREGAFTGEVSGAMIKEAGAEYAIIGHSERRRLFGETDETVKRKTVAALATDLTPIMCVGETLEEREKGEMLAVLDRQVRDGLAGLTGEQVASLVLAYEPVWAIGTGRVATAAQAQEAHAHIRRRLSEQFGASAAERCHIVYGGSVKPDNIAELIREADVDGALVGGASLDAAGFSRIVSQSRRDSI
jgi:triosephosphate isomerase